MFKKKLPGADLKRNYRKVLEVSIVGSLLIHLILFHGLPSFDLGAQETSHKRIEIKVEDVPPTEQAMLPPPPARPSIPIPTESEDVPEDITIETTELDLSEIPPPPPPPEDRNIWDNYTFVAYDEPPVPIGGLEAILANLVYPAIARKAGIEGHVVLGILIDENGTPIKTQILSSTNPKLGFNEAAQKAAMSVKWQPAKQRDKPVKVWVSIPIQFQLQQAL